MIGKQLEHIRFGRGTVQAARHKGLELYVLFDDGLQRWVRIEDVRFLTSAPVIERMLPPKPTLTTEELRSRSMIEAFRLGIVPYARVEDFTFGRDGEIFQIKEWLRHYDMGTLIVEGEYGSGKSHLLEYVYALAINQGYAVAMTELDPNEAPPFRPKAVYRKLIQTFRYKDGGEIKSFRDFLKAVAKNGIDRFRNHRYLYNVLLKIGTTQESESLWNWIEGKESFYLSALYNHGTAANIYCNILSALGWAAFVVLKLNGLVIILDEAESVDTGWYYRYQVNKGFNLFCGLTLLAANDDRLKDEAIVENRTGIGTWYGRETDLIYHGLSKVRYCFRNPSFLKVAFAFTPIYTVDWLKELQTQMLCLRLKPLSEKALKEVFEHICLLYDSGYGFLESDRNVQKCFEVISDKSTTITRSFIKGSVELLDIRRFHPNLSPEQIE